jgi:type II secretory pathway pseudopilin PulG
MAAVLIGIALLSVVMSALLPAWRQQMRREREAELAFRGEQYARAIYLFQQKNPGMYPPSFEFLVQNKYLRKEFKDPIANADFVPLQVGQQPQPGQGGNPGRAGGPGGAGRGSPGTSLGQPSQPGRGGFGSIPGGAIMGVQSKSTEASIRIYNGAGYYNQWRFIYRGRGRGNPQQQPGAPDGRGRQGGPGVGAPGGPGRGGPIGVPGPGRGGPIGMPGPGRGRGPGGGGRGPIR